MSRYVFYGLTGEVAEIGSKKSLMLLNFDNPIKLEWKILPDEYCTDGIDRLCLPIVTIGNTILTHELFHLLSKHYIIIKQSSSRAKLKKWN